MRRSIEAALCIALLAILVVLMLAAMGRMHGREVGQREKTCRTLAPALKLAAQRATSPDTADAARDVGVVLAPWVELCTRDHQLRRDLEALAIDHDRYRNVSTLTRAVAAAEAAQ